MIKIILCVDDTPVRYNRLAALAAERGFVVVVTCRFEDVKFYLDNDCYDPIGVCLDHDMPNYDGTSFAREFFMERNIPVVISSHNPGGSEKIAAVLDTYLTPYCYAPAKNRDYWVQEVLNFFTSPHQEE